jgi:hypothetical protein
MTGLSSSQPTGKRRLTYDLDSDLVSFDPPLPLPMGREIGRAFDKMMSAMEEFREAMQTGEPS